MEIITAKDNKKIKEARKLLTKKKYRQKSYLIEGFHLLEEAMNSKAEILQIFVEENKYDKVANCDKVVVVSAEVLKSLSDTGTPQGVIAEVAHKSQEVLFNQGKFLVLENVQDPGNVGTMIRTADAAGYTAVLCLGETADVYAPKVMRSMQGSNFHIPIKLLDSLEILKNAEIPLYVTTLSENSVSHKELVAESSFALIMGNEGSGVTSEAVAAADKLIHIEMPGQAESLNVAVAAGILMFSI
ncbi:TrmH family RNA methyltransferase [Lactococcus garvieae]|uniref:TrmH family RNA methyltransferase n=1 Tax=Lactococcus garvieae TaxID=1363 RepID=UPI0009C10F87|nr:RNA methyltransferase [Lactococcus garvieae]